MIWFSSLHTLIKEDASGFSWSPTFLDCPVRASSFSFSFSVIDCLCFTGRFRFDHWASCWFQGHCAVKINLLFTLPNLHSSSICTLEQLSPISYQLNGLCFGGAISRHDLLLLSCEDKRYVVTQTELEQCFHADSTMLCPDHVQSTVENPNWLGLKWISGSELSFKHAHIPLQGCHNLQPLIHLGGRYYLSTSHTNLALSSPHNGSHVISLQPLGIYHFPCSFSFPFPRTGFGSCAPHITIYFPLFSEGNFQYIPWFTRLL